MDSRSVTQGFQPPDIDKSLNIMRHKIMKLECIYIVNLHALLHTVIRLITKYFNYLHIRSWLYHYACIHLRIPTEIWILLI